MPVRTYPYSPPPFPFCCYLNEANASKFNGAYALGDPESQFLPVTTTGAQRLTLPIMVAVNSAEEAIAFYHANTYFATETPLHAEEALAVGHRPDGLSAVYTDLLQAKASEYYDALCATVPVIYVVLNGWAPGIYFDEEQARWSMVNHDRDLRSGHAFKGGPGGFQAAVRCYTNYALRGGSYSCIDAIHWVNMVPHEQVGGTIPRVSRPLATGHITVKDVDIPPVTEHNALVHGAELIQLEDIYQYFWSHDIVMPTTPPVSPASLAKLELDLRTSTPTRPLSPSGIHNTSAAGTLYTGSPTAGLAISIHGSAVFPSSPASFSSLSSRGQEPSNIFARSADSPLRTRCAMLPIPDLVKLYIGIHFYPKDHLDVISRLQEAISYSNDVAKIHAKFLSLPTYMSRAGFDLAVRVYLMAIERMLS